MKAWLKGGIIGGIFGFLDVIIFILFQNAPIVSNISFIFISFIWLLLMVFSYSSYILPIILSTIIYFIIGALIGFIVGKIKRKIKR